MSQKVLEAIEELAIAVLEAGTVSKLKLEIKLPKEVYDGINKVFTPNIPGMPPLPEFTIKSYVVAAGEVTISPIEVIDGN